MISSSTLQEGLERIFGKQTAGVSLQVYSRGNHHEANLNGFNPSSATSIGCLAKSLVATLVGIAQASNKLSLDSLVGNYFTHLPVRADFAEHLARTSIGHLLNHTHGLDHSMLLEAPRTSDGRIDAASLLQSLQTFRPLFQSGTACHYNNVGAWLTAAILEQVYERPYFVVLDELLLSPFQMTAQEPGDAALACAAGGGSLRLSTGDLLRLALAHMHGAPQHSAPIESLLTLRNQYRHSLPPSPMGGENSCPGWFDFGGSFGHLGFGADGSAAVRIIPEQDIAIAVTGAHKNLANGALSTLFKELLPDFGRTSTPRPIAASEWASIDTGAYEGVFENSRYTMRIDRAANGSLRTKVFRKCNEQGREDSEPYVKRYLKALAGDVFLPQEPESQVCPSLRFSHRESQVFQYISTGKYMFVRTG